MMGIIMSSNIIIAQNAPKWADKSKKAVFSVITYDKTNKIKNTGNGFYINDNGMALSDYTLFDGADRAVIVNADGKELPIESIQGANSIYDVIKFKVAPDKKSVSLKVAQNAPAIGETVYLLPYSTQKEATCQTGKILKVDTIADKGFYYTLDFKTNPKIISCPIMNANGEVIGAIQKNASDNDKESYAIGASYGASLSISPLSANDASLNKIGIKKGLPDTEDQALVYLMMASGQLTPEEYLSKINDFIQMYPNNADGYLRRATYYMNLNQSATNELADNDIKKLMDLSKNKDEGMYNAAKLIYSYNITMGDKNTNNSWSYDKALSLTRDAIKVNPTPIYTQLEGDILFAMRNFAEAFNSYQKVNHSNLASAATYFSASKAKQLTEGADMNEAVALLDSAVAKFTKPYVADAAPYIYERGALKAQLGKHREAVADYNTFSDILIGNVSAQFYYQREQSEIQCKMYQQALNDINKAVEMEPTDAVYWTEKGSLHIRIGQIKEAVEALEKAISLDNKAAEAYRMLGYCMVQQKKNAEACANFAKAKELGDKVAESLIAKYCK